MKYHPRSWTVALIVSAILCRAGPSLAVGGDTCGAATVIAAVPYTDTGKTCPPTFLNWIRRALSQPLCRVGSGLHVHIADRSRGRSLWH